MQIGAGRSTQKNPRACYKRRNKRVDLSAECFVGSSIAGPCAAQELLVPLLLVLHNLLLHSRRGHVESHRAMCFGTFAAAKQMMIGSANPDLCFFNTQQFEKWTHQYGDLRFKVQQKLPALRRGKLLLICQPPFRSRPFFWPSIPLFNLHLASSQKLDMFPTDC